MKPFFFFGVIAILLIYQETTRAQISEGELTDTTNISTDCLAALHRQIVIHFDSSILYLKFAAYFAQVTIDLPGFEKFFFHAADEEREKGIQLIEYAVLRNLDSMAMYNFNLNYVYETLHGLSGENALRVAIDQQNKVTQSISELIKVCKQGNSDFYLGNHMGGDYLYMQHVKLCELDDRLNQLHQLMTVSRFGEFLYDKDHM